MVVVGAQRGWAERCADPDAAAGPRAAVLERARAVGSAVIVVVHRRPADRAPRRGAPPEDATLIDVGVVPDLIVDAAGHDAFYGGRLGAELAAAGRDVVVVMGYGLEGPVESTIRSASDRQFRTLVVPECCAGLAGDPVLDAPSWSVSARRWLVGGGAVVAVSADELCASFDDGARVVTR